MGSVLTSVLSGVGLYSLFKQKNSSSSDNSTDSTDTTDSTKTTTNDTETDTADNYRQDASGNWGSQWGDNTSKWKKKNSLGLTNSSSTASTTFGG